MPRRIIRNAIQLDALPASLTTAGKRKPATRKKAAKAVKPTAAHRPLPGETWEQRAARLRDALFADLRAAGLAPWLGAPYGPEHQFAKQSHGRKWAFDLAWPAPEARIALEIEGRGSHQRGRYLSDMQKYNTAAVLGWLLMRVTYDMIEDGEALALIRAAFAYRRAQSA